MEAGEVSFDLRKQLATLLQKELSSMPYREVQLHQLQMLVRLSVCSERLIWEGRKSAAIPLGARILRRLRLATEISLWSRMISGLND